MTGKTIGDHRILKKLGKGGMGVVYRAEQISLGRMVALKILPLHLTGNTSFVERFMNEARSMAALNHPNIVQIHNVGQEGKTYYYTMELIDGTSLDKLLTRRETLPLDQTVNIMTGVATALAYLHKRGMLHRDIKSSNIMLSRSGEVKLADFGLALMEGMKRLTIEGGLIGTPEYMSPEQASGEGATALSDIYSLGVVFYEALTGKLPFKSDSPLALLKKIQTDEERPPRLINPDIPTEADEIIRKMMAKNPGERHQNCEEVLADLRELQAKVLPAPTAFGFSLSRRRIALAASIMGAVLFIGATGLFLVGSSKRIEKPPAEKTGEAVSPPAHQAPVSNVEGAKLAIETARNRAAVDLIPLFFESTFFRINGIELRSVDMHEQGVIISGMVGQSAPVDASTRFSRLQANFREHCPEANVEKEETSEAGLSFHIKLQHAADFVNCMADHPKMSTYPLSRKAWRLAEKRLQRGDLLQSTRVYVYAEKSYMSGEELYARSLEIAKLENSVALLREELGIPPGERPFPVLPDRVVLKNGGEIRCEIIKTEPDSVRIRTGSGVVQISRDRIQSLIPSTPEERQRLSELQSAFEELGKHRDELGSVMDEIKSFSIRDAIDHLPKGG